MENDPIQPTSLQIDATTLECRIFPNEQKRQQTLDLFRRFRPVLLPVFRFPRRPADMGAEDVQHRLAQVFGILRQMEELVGSAQAHGIRSVAQMLDGVLQPLLPPPVLRALVGFRLRRCRPGLRLRRPSLRLRRILQRHGALVRDHGPDGQQHAAHGDAEKLQNPEFLRRAEETIGPCRVVEAPDGQKDHEQTDQQGDENQQNTPPDQPGNGFQRRHDPVPRIYRRPPPSATTGTADRPMGQRSGRAADEFDQRDRQGDGQGRLCHDHAERDLEQVRLGGAGLDLLFKPPKPAVET